MATIIIAVVAAGLLSGLVGFWIGEIGNRGNGLTGAVLGALLGPVGWIITAVMRLERPGEGTPRGPDQGERERIARLEAELAALRKGAARQPGKTRKPGGGEDEGGIPTYKLD